MPRSDDLTFDEVLDELPAHKRRQVLSIVVNTGKKKSKKQITELALVFVFICMPIWTVGTALCLTFIFAWLGIPIIALGGVILALVDETQK